MIPKNSGLKPRLRRVTLSECRNVAFEVLVFFRRVFAIQQFISVRKSAELLDYIGMQFSELEDGIKGFFVRR